jgi:hypothetical protein
LIAEVERETTRELGAFVSASPLAKSYQVKSRHDTKKDRDAGIIKGSDSCHDEEGMSPGSGWV